MPRIRQDVTGSSYVTGSGFILRDPRLLLRDSDNNPGTYPVVRRDGDQSRRGALTSNFDDRTTIIFSADSSPVFPSMLPRGSAFGTQALDIAGEVSDISVTLPIRSFQHPTHLQYSSSEDLAPFDENHVIANSDFFLSGTNSEISPGFSSPIRSKMAIEIDITPTSEVKLTRNVSARNTSEGQPVSADNTGFYYYNFSRSAWEQIGLTDPATGASLKYDFAINNATNQTSGTFPSQFTFGNVSAKERDIAASAGDQRLALGYSKIGSPTVALSAPAATKYHATSSQCLRLSNLISSPFLLEAVKVDISEAKAQRTNGGSTGTSSPDIFKKGSLRDIDNYVFFMYRQSRKNRVVDSTSDVTSSTRHLICSASMTFWNSASLSGSSWAPGTLLHSPAFSYEFGMPYSDDYSVGTFTGSISLNIKPAVCGPQYLGVTRVPEYDGVGTDFIQNLWGGGTTPKVTNLSGYNLNIVYPYNSSSGEGLTTIIESYTSIDERPIRKLGSAAQVQDREALYGFGLISSVGQNSEESPYLLLPGDELIFGLEAGIAQLPFSQLVSNITGSHLIISNKSCRVTLYGSMIKDGIEKLPELNQNLTSNSIHEVIGSEIIQDQFQIEPVSSYYGSRLDEIVSGTMATPISGGILFDVPGQDASRRVVSKVSLGQASTTGSLQRFCKISNPFERTYDSYLPDIASFLSGVAASSVETDSYRSLIWGAAEEDRLWEKARFWNKQFPFVGNPKRYAKQKDTIIYVENVPLAAEPTSLTGSVTPVLSALDYTFRTGYKFPFTLDYTGTPVEFIFKHRASAALVSAPYPLSENPFTKGSYRYGISSTTPEYSSTRVRSDHYGYFRDTLEQRIDTSFNGRKPPISCRFVSGSKVLSDPTDTHCQNISPFATSSLPFFDDDVARNRSDNPDETLLIVLS